MDESKLKEVFFDQYCGRCSFEKEPSDEGICDECLSEPARFDSHKPAKFVEKSSAK